MIIYRVIVVVLLLGLIGILLFKNKKEIDRNTALAEVGVTEWPVVTKVVKTTTINEKLTASGLLKPSEQVTIFASFQGLVTKSFKKEGDRVVKGDVIGKIDDELLRNELRVSEATLAQARSDLQRMINLEKGEAITSQQLELAQLKVTAEEAKQKSIKKRLYDSNIRAAISGSITSLAFKTGEMVSPGRPLGIISDLESYIFTVEFSPLQVASLAPEKEVNVRIDEMPAKEFRGRPKSISSVTNTAAKYEVDITIIDEQTDQLKSGMFATASFESGERQVILVDRDVILGGLERPYVYLLNGNQAAKTPINLGRISEAGVEVLSGLKDGDELIISGHTNLSEGSMVKVMDF